MTADIIVKALASTAKYLLMAVPVMAMGIFVMSLLQNSGMIRRISWIARPLVRFGRLKEPVAVTFVTSFGSPSAANAMLRGLYDKKEITGRELMIAVLANAFPVMVMEMRSMLPAMVSLLGETGALMFCLLLALRFIQTIMVLTAGRLLLPRDGGASGSAVPAPEPLRGRRLVVKSISDTLPPIRRIGMITAPVTLATYILLGAGVFEALSGRMTFLTRIFPVPIEGVGVVAAYFGHYVAGYTMAGSLLSGGALTVKQTIITLLTAKVLSSVVFALRHSTPYYIGIFGTRLGTRIMLASTMLRNAVNIAAIAALQFLWP